jgi:hypothetical protein
MSMSPSNNNSANSAGARSLASESQATLTTTPSQFKNFDFQNLIKHQKALEKQENAKYEIQRFGYQLNSLYRNKNFKLITISAALVMQGLLVFPRSLWRMYA